MHEQAYDAVRRMRPAVARRVYEVGSLDINGSVRPLFADAEAYHGIDAVSGPAVDAVGDGATYEPPFEPDCVVCCEVLEHAANAEGIVRQLAKVLAHDGTMVLTCAGPGRWPHSAVDGGRLRDDEHYCGISPFDLREWMESAGLSGVHVEIGQGVPGASIAGRLDADVYAMGAKR